MTNMRYRRAITYARHLLNYLESGKVTNYIKYGNDIRTRKIINSSFPPQIAFQASAYCNTNCQLCPVGLNLDGPERGFLEFDRFKSIIDDTKQYLTRIDFGDWGEPFLNPNIFDMIEYAEAQKVMAAASTNLHSFKDEGDLGKILDSGLSFLVISLHGVSQESYEAYQPGKNLEQTVDKIKTLISMKGKLKKTTPIVDFMFAITRKNQHEIDLMHQFAGALGGDSIAYPASLNLRFYMNDVQTLKDLTTEWALEAKRLPHDTGAFGKDRATLLYEAVLKDNMTTFEELDQHKHTGRHFCLDPWRSLVVNWDGTVCLCCVDYSKYSMGDTKTDSIVEIWNNEKYQAIRKYLSDGKYTKLDFPCKKCIIY